MTQIAILFYSDYVRIKLERGPRRYLYPTLEIFWEAALQNRHALLPLKERELRTIKAVEQVLHYLRQSYYL